jgi:hypothetical protein
VLSKWDKKYKEIQKQKQIDGKLDNEKQRIDNVIFNRMSPNLR